MAILHGSWVVESELNVLFIWGETWRRVTPVKVGKKDSILSHPLAMTEEELISFLQSRGLFIDKFIPPKTDDLSHRWLEKAIALPTQIQETGKTAFPLYSGATNTAEESIIVRPWQVKGLYLRSPEAIQFLQALPLSSFQASDAYIGADLRFWTHIARWSLELVARCKFLPVLQEQDGAIATHWQPLLDSATDRSRLDKFTQLMPSACYSYLPTEGDKNNQNVSSPQELLLSFLSITVDALVRNWAASQSPPATEAPIRQWLQALVQKSAIVGGEAELLARIQTALRSWIYPVQEHLFIESDLTTKDSASKFLISNQYRTCFVLKPPVSSESNWRLEYCLQALDNPEFLVEAETIWNNVGDSLTYRDRQIKYPQEILLKGLGLALRVYPLILPSLQTQQPKSCPITALEAYSFIKAATWRLQDIGLGVVLPDSLTPGKAENKRLGLKVIAATKSENVRLGLQSLLDFEWELAIGEQVISQKEFKQIVALQTPFIEINGEWVAIQQSDIKAAQTLLAKPKNEIALSVEDALRLSTGDTNTLEKLPVVSFEARGGLEDLINNLTDNKKIETIAVPASFIGELRPYQIRGVAWLAFLERWGLGGCLADDMGLGKTPQAIAFLLHLQEQGKLNEPTLLICPTSVLGNWEREVNKFSNTLKTLVHHGYKRPKGKNFISAIKGKDLVITSYPLAFRDGKTLQSISWQGVLLDEAQNIKNPQAKQSQMVRELKAGFRMALTGTPVENKLQELWSILDFVNPQYLGNRQFFQRRFAIPIEKYGDKQSLETLRSLVKPFILRRLKTDRDIIQDLPEKQEMNVFCGLSGEQAALYQKLVDESLPNIDDAEGIKRRAMILTLLLRLKQVCNHPAQYLKEESVGSSQRSGKLMRLEEMLEEVLEEGDRALIFTQFAEAGKLLQPYLQKKFGAETLFLYGDTRKQQREEMVDRFQNEPDGPRILILSLKAGGTGLNLTRANHVFHFDRWWNPAVENQATDRAFRIGQTRNVQVHKFICNGTLEEKINALIESKKALAEQTVDAGENWLTEMDTDQLRNLLLLDRTAVIDEVDNL